MTCPICDAPARSPVVLKEAPYAFFLAGYLGDGSIARVNKAKRSMRLSITLDDVYPGIQYAFEMAFAAVLPEAPRRRAAKPGCHDVVVTHHHLPCLLPQHGPGRKHGRSMALRPWQAEIVGRHPWEFLRGAIYTDGSIYRNRIVTPAGRRHEYATYAFRNRSPEILELVAGCARNAGLRPSMQRESVVLARRPDVARLLSHIGTKDAVNLGAVRFAWELGSVWHAAVDALWHDTTDALPAEARSPARCRDCSAPISREGRRCKACAGIARGGTVSWPPFDDLVREVTTTSARAVGRRLGVSDVAVQKRLRRHQAQRDRRRAA